MTEYLYLSSGSNVSVEVQGQQTVPYQLKKLFKGPRPRLLSWGNGREKFFPDKGSLICQPGKSMMFQPSQSPKYLIACALPALHQSVFNSTAFSLYIATKINHQLITELTFFLPSGLSIIALVSVEGYHGYLLFVWIYGIFLGGYQFSLKVYTLEKVRVRQFPRGWGFVQGIKFLPILLGIPGLATNSILFCLLFCKKSFFCQVRAN